MTTASDDPPSSALCVVCAERFPRGVPGGAGMPPPGYAQRSRQCLEFFFWAVFAIFSGLLKIIPVLGIRVLVSTEYLKALYILYSEW
jgi:hypothetical protein